MQFCILSCVQVLSLAPACSHDDIMTQWHCLNAAELAVARELRADAKGAASLPGLVSQYRHMLYQCISVINGQKHQDEEKMIVERQASAAAAAMSLQTLERQHELLSHVLTSAKLVCV
jgi:hypothetical protein